MSTIKPYRAFIKALSDFGIYPELSNKHMKLIKNGRVVASMSCTPGDKWVAIDHTLRHLMQQGDLPNVNRKNYVHELKQLHKASK